MNIHFDSSIANGVRGESHSLAQFNVRAEPDYGLFTLYEHDCSPFRVDLFLPEVERLMEFHSYLCHSWAAPVPRRLQEVRLAADLVQHLGSDRALFQALRKVLLLVRFLEAEAEAGLEADAERSEFVKFLSSLPCPPMRNKKKRNHDRSTGVRALSWGDGSGSEHR